jgi:4-amino-4-deoxy-L-arabinose transferase-like glycosyltransferase
VLTVFLVALAARGLFLASNGVRAVGDTPDYVALARNLVEQGAFSLSPGPPFIPTIRRPPLYPLFLAASFRDGAFFETRAVVLQVVLDALVAVEVFWLASMVAASGWALAAALVYALHPTAIAASSTLLSESLFVLLSVSAVLALAAALRRDRGGLTILAGVVLGLAALCRSIAVLALLVLGATALLTGAGPPRRLRHVALLLGGAALVVAPWTARCTLVSGEFVLIQSAAAINWYVPTLSSLDQGDEARLWPYFFNQDPYGRRVAAAHTPQDMLAAHRFGYRQAVANVRADPVRYLKSRARTYPHLMLNSGDAFTGINRSFGSLWRARDVPRLAVKALVVVGFSALPLLLGVAGLRRARESVTASLCAAVWVSVMLVHVPLWIEHRFWLPAVPCLLVSAAAGAAWLTARVRWGRASFARPAAC